MQQVGDWRATRIETRYGCFLPDLTGLARDPSATSLPRHYIRKPPRDRKAGRARTGSSDGTPAPDHEDCRRGELRRSRRDEQPRRRSGLAGRPGELTQQAEGGRSEGIR